MKLKQQFITYSVDDSTILVGTDQNTFNGIAKANAAAAFILDCLKEETDTETIIQKLLNKYDVDKETVAKDVDDVLSALKSIQALDI